MLSPLKSRLKAVLPAPLLHILRLAFNSDYRQYARSEHFKALAKLAEDAVWDASAGQILSGPFKGLRYIRQSVCSSLCPKLLGTYELELHQAINSLISSLPRNIIIIGAAEGYYACGLAMKLPAARITAFEADEAGRDLLRSMTQANGMEKRISIRGYCDHQELHDVLALCNPVDTAIICDIEGGEMDLIDPILHPGLQKCRMIIELHPWTTADPAAVLHSRLEATSACVHTMSIARHLPDFPSSIDTPLSAVEKLACLDEFRPAGMGWLTITPKPF